MSKLLFEWKKKIAKDFGKRGQLMVVVGGDRESLEELGAEGR